MYLSWIDWTIVGLLMVFICTVGFFSRSLTKSVADFLSANRCAGRYLLSVSGGMAGLGAISIVAIFEKFYQAGFAAQWWTWMITPIGIIISLSGWVTYRFRETKALTMAQFFEMRYSRRFRIFSGILAWVSGILNYGIFPGITARFIITFCGFPNQLNVFGISIPTLAVVMIIMLSVALFLTFCGGQVAVMISDFFQGQLVMITFLVMAFMLIFYFGWDTILVTLQSAPEGASMLNPFDQKISKVKDFNITFFLIMAFVRVYGVKVWQGSQGYNSAAKSAHEARMAGIIGEWRNQTTLLATMLVPICAWVLMHNSSYAADAESVTNSLKVFSEVQLQKQMLVPMALTKMLPVGMMGLFTVVILAAALSTDDTYLHSWGSIFIQDVIMPFRKKPFDAKKHMFLLKAAIFWVAAFSFFFSLFFPLKDYIYMYFALTGAIYVGGAGSVIIGGLYWQRGTTAGAWAGMSVGGLLAIVGVIVKTFWESLPYFSTLAPKCPLNGIHLTFIAGVVAIVAYVVVSLLTCKKPFDLDAMLHRDKAKAQARKEKKTQKTFSQMLGITDEFTGFDKFIYFFKIVWSFFWVAAFLVGTAWGLTHKTTDEAWGHWWFFMVILTLAMCVLTVIWFVWGGTKDLISLYQTLSGEQRDLTDDGWVKEDGPEKITGVIEEEMDLPKEHFDPAEDEEDKDPESKEYHFIINNRVTASCKKFKEN